ncbi:MAG: pilus assembly protein PilM [Candidatus Omnitrophota bacterium]
MFKVRDLIAIDLSSRDLKIAHLIFSRQKKEIRNLALHKIENLSEDEIAQIIKELTKGLPLAKSHIVVAIPSFLTITKNIEIPSRDPNEIKEIINLQASRHTPYSREEIIIDYINIGVHKQNYTKVLLVIATRTVIRRQLEILTKAGLNIERMAFAPEGIGHIISRNLKLAQDVPANIIHITETFTDFMVILKSKVIFVRNIPIGLSHLSSEREKYEPKFIEEAKKSLEAYSSEDIGKAPTRFFLTGAVDDNKFLVEILNTNLGVTIETLSYFDYFSIAPKVAKTDLFKNKQVSFLDSIAPLFAYDETMLDLVPEEIKLERVITQRGREVIKAGILVMAAFVLVYCLLLVKIYVRSSYLKDLSVRYSSIHMDAEKLKSTFSKNQIIKDCLASRGYPLEVLVAVYDALSLDVEIGYLKFETDKAFAIEGRADSMSAVFSFVDRLTESPYFEKVETRYTRQKRVGEKDLADFAFICQLNHP